MAENGNSGGLKVQQWLNSGNPFQVTHYNRISENDPKFASGDLAEMITAPGLDEPHKKGFLGSPYGVKMQGTGTASDGRNIMWAGNGRYAYGAGGAYAPVERPLEQIAVDPTVIPKRSKVYVDCHKRVMSADDTGSAIKGNHIDVYVGAMEYDKVISTYGPYGSSKLAIVDPSTPTGPVDASATPVTSDNITGGQTTGGAPVAQEEEKTASGTGKVNCDVLNMRNSGSMSGTIIGTLNNNTEVSLLAQNTDWYKVSVNGKVGWVYKKYITLQESAKVENVTTTAEQIYVVKSGDTLSKIADMYHVEGGYQALARYNNITNPNRINAGQKIRIPGTTVAKTDKDDEGKNDRKDENTDTGVSTGEIITKPNTGKSSLATSHVDLDEKSNERPGKVSKITIHHMAGVSSGENSAYDHLTCGRDVSANYYVGSSGDICAGVSENRRAWTSNSRENDFQAITIETSNCKGEPNWEVSDVTYNALINLCRDLCSRYGITPNYTGDAGGTLTTHKMFTATACPGPYLENKLKTKTLQNDILNGITKKSDDKKTDDTKTEEPKSGETKSEEPAKPVAQTIGVGSKVRITASNYSTGQSIPGWVKNGIYTVSEVRNGNKALLKEIFSLVNLDGLELVSDGVPAGEQKTEPEQKTDPAKKTDPEVQPGEQVELPKGAIGEGLDVALTAQETNYTCSAASGAMSLRTRGLDVTESQLWQKQNQDNCVGSLTKAMNSYAGGAYTYTSGMEGKYNTQQYFSLIQSSLANGCAPVVRIKPSAVAQFGYPSSGHYICVSKAYTLSGKNYVEICDPYSSNWKDTAHTGQRIQMEIGNLYEANKAASYGAWMVHANGASPDYVSNNTLKEENASPAENEQEIKPEEPAKTDTQTSGDVELNQTGYVTANDGLNLRPTPDTSQTRLTCIPRNAWVDIIGKASNGWYKVTYQGMTGYVCNDYIKIAEKPAPGSWLWPTTATTITSQFGPRDPLQLTNGNSSGNFHRGIDISGGGGSPIYAAKAGTATTLWDGGGYGNWIQIDHGDGTYSRYAHMRQMMFSGTKSVEAGEQIGIEGATGGVTGPHLHFEIRIGGTSNDCAVDPLKYVSP